MKPGEIYWVDLVPDVVPVSLSRGKALIRETPL